ncbi:MAG: Allantoinase [Candidatus Nomurabacteria bacterium GW2011_GWA2_41_25]|uniref:Amidohydrolase n=3 Tax=Candidatus Nomuraibacteriota TaxID=1752729 RepID=A0A1F6YA38_9BACT|nr:MAG: Allantoinase [Candidatus Nomurabacteria bacterium GW2011_GWA2_41_25]OGI67622.1 MAG: amidohydrolase [Candidatus Nomurabacteria bacterium RIFCSPHIGHO2_01_FULL_41_91]OGI84800.1 MAG: amidohydrolase [Candidatus Nomurabacteria bacterium RIFCSPHIGHO2_12_FULL_42_19]OGI94263.1 MAG: amidohydrolase [Candidatus Nomurabacteria bacterium RIFCSPLOWO2_01_FULL_41_52]OGI97963.1 MAG: amidohydrolase [Candidatus Nomurabacteria bacterium RIFCSPLOWO2_02_FULL_42_24]OGJ03253.1 MAG: amidohydrolase [Candidatus N
MFSIEGIIANTGERKRIEIDQTTELITKVGEPTGVADVLLKDELIFPGFVDLHVHARECTDHSQDYKEDFKTAGVAAINGGVVAFAEMPNNPVPPIDNSSYDAKNILAKKSGVEVLLYAGIGPHTEPLSRKVPYKVFMGPSIGELFFTDKIDLEKVISKYSGQNVSFHCEDPEILNKNKNETTHERRRPPEAETSAIDFALSMIEKYNLQGKICHCSTAEGIRKIKNAKMRKVNVVAEVSPHHLYFSGEMLTENNREWMRMNPPLRTAGDKNYLTEALRDGTIDFLATDHAPHSQEEKTVGMSGTPQLDTYGPFATWLMKERNFSPEEIARACSANPGNFFNQFSPNRYGKIKEGYIGSLTILNINKPTTITKDILKTKCGWSPFEGITFPGSVAMTIIKGVAFAKASADRRNI